MTKEKITRSELKEKRTANRKVLKIRITPEQ